ncbi:MAG: Na(+)-translocating NADH-quinone reductase subunit C [Natronospirillum sp.]
MSKRKDSIQHTLLVAFLVCLVCAIVVSAAAVSLRPMQQQNVVEDMKRNILSAAGMLDSGRSVAEQFEVVETRVIDLASGQFVDVDPDAFDQRKAAQDPAQSRRLDPSEDMASIRRLEEQSLVYIVRGEDDSIQTLILPVRGYGLWSTLYGFLALEGDLNTVAGLGFYEHAETPGLGGEVDNPRWKQQWVGRKVYDAEGDLGLSVRRGTVERTNDYERDHYIDGLSGATLTSRGVDGLIQFWMGEDGFRTFLDNLQAGEA